MPIDFKPASRGPTQEAPNERPAVQYKPTRTSPSMGSSAPIPNATGEVRIRGAQDVAPPTQQAPDAQDGDAGEGEGSPDELAQRVDLSKRLSILNQKERRIRERQQAAAAMEARIKAQEEAFAERERRIAEWEAKDAERRRSPRQVLLDYGFSPEAALQFELNKGQLTPEQQAALKLDETLAAERAKTAEELQSIREEQARMLKEREEAERQAEEQAAREQEQMAIEEMHLEIGDILTSDKDSFPLLTMSDNGSAVVFARLQEYSDQQFEQTGRRPPVTTRLIEQVSKQVEAEARKELEAANERLGFKPAPQLPRTPQTLTNREPRRVVQADAPPQETEAEKRARMLSTLDGIFGRNRGR